MTKIAVDHSVLPKGWASRDAIQLVEVADAASVSRHVLRNVAEEGHVRSLDRRGKGNAILVGPDEAARIILGAMVAAALGIALTAVMRAVAARPELLGQAGAALSALGAEAIRTAA